MQNQLGFGNTVVLPTDEEQDFETQTSYAMHDIENDESATFVTADDGGNDGENASDKYLSSNPSEPSDENSVYQSLHSSHQDELTVENFNKGDRVLVCDIHPTHKRKQGTVMGTTKCFVKVLFAGSASSAKPTLIAPKFLTVLRSESNSTNSTTTASTEDDSIGVNSALNHSMKSILTQNSGTISRFNKGDKVQVLNTHQHHGNKCGVVIRTTNCFVFFADTSTNEEIRIQPKFLSRAPSTEHSPSHSENDAFHSAECSVVSQNLSSKAKHTRNISNRSSNTRQCKTKLKTVINPQSPQFVLERLCYAVPRLTPDSAFKRMWHGKYLIREYDLPLGKNSYSVPPLELKFQFDGKNYELYYADVQNDPRRGMASGARIVKANKIATYYVQTDDLRRHEECLADFGSLKPRKVWARRKLFLSEAVKLPKSNGLLTVFRADIAMVKDNGTVGCGFICEQYLERLLGGGAAAKRTLGIQVRIFVPSLGVFKGVLVRKRQSTGPPIELNESLQKVLPSTLEDADDHGYIVIKRTFPSHANLQIGRLFRRDRAVTKSFKASVQSREKCKLSDMYVRLLNGLGVPKEMTDEYSKLYKNLKHLRHTHLVGVADPTGKLPPNTVFVTGVKRGDFDVEKIFVTRPPCLEPEDGRLIELITTRPHCMPQNDWDWLNGLYFGALVFANPIEGQRPLPELIADGDLDGDLYFVCWDKKILSTIRHVPIERDDLCASIVEGTLKYDADWFDKTQNFISDVSNIVSVHDFVGFLFNQSEKIADEKSIRDADAIAYAKAYKQALEFKKHGEKIFIPAHLLSCVPEHFHKFCHSI
ncbi:hypothetical protein ACHAW6_011774 [Cyclotella cf. meneghiniana]